MCSINAAGLATSLTIGRVQITATSGSIRASTTLIAVISEIAGVPRFAYVANNADNTISAYTVNPTTGQLRNNSYAFGGKLPQAVVVDPSHRFLYVVNSGDNTISAFLINSSNGALTPLAGSPFPTGSRGAISLTVDPSGAFAYVANTGSNNVSAFSIDPVTGAFTAIAGSPFPAGAGPQSIVTDPFGKFVYVTNFPANNVSGYTIDPATGALTAAAGSPFTAGSEPSAVTVDPSGQFAYVANSGSADVSAFSINSATGALAALPGSPFATGAGMEIAGVTVDPTGKLLYVANFGSNSVSAFSIGSGGGLTAVSGSPFAVSSSPRSVQIDPSGKFAYVPALTADEVEVFSIKTTGALSLVGEVRTRQQAAAIAFSEGTAAVKYSPTFAYVANILSDNVSAFAINPGSGILTPIAGSPFAAGSRPFGVTIDPGGKFVYVTNGNSNNVSVYAVDLNTGSLNPVSGSPFPAGVGSQLGTPAVDPSGRFLYVPNYSSLWAVRPAFFGLVDSVIWKNVGEEDSGQASTGRCKSPSSLPPPSRRGRAFRFDNHAQFAQWHPPSRLLVTAPLDAHLHYFRIATQKVAFPPTGTDYNYAHAWPLPLAPNSGRTRYNPRLARAAWARCIRRAIACP